MTDSIGIITGAAGGIGRATAERFAKEGWSLILVDIDENVKKFAGSLPAKNGQTFVGVTADVTTEKGVATVDAAVKASGKPLRFLGLIAGTLQEVGSIETINLAEWDRVMGV